MRSDNTNPIVKRIVVLCKMNLRSPVLVGGGESELSDRDVYVDANGEPLIPGTALAGVLRSSLPTCEAELLFGKSTNNADGMGRTSPLWVFDAPLKSSSGACAETIVIDNVALDENKVAKKGSKFDFQAVERGSVFDLRLMLIVRKDDINKKHDLEAMLDKLLGQLDSLYIGGKTSRGFGKLKCTKFYRQIFLTNEPKHLDKWLEFAWCKFANDKLEIKVEQSKLAMAESICASLNLDGTILIRDDYSITGDENTAHITSAGIPVIYGTSWAGAIRNGLARFLKSNEFDCENYLSEVFGIDATSQIRIDASYFGNDPKKYDKRHEVTRVKIDRWTGGAADSALFKTKPQFGGTVKLTIHYPRGNAAIRELLLLALEAINLGIITIGGETAIGRGKFNIIDIDGDHDINKIFALPKDNLICRIPKKEGFKSDCKI